MTGKLILEADADAVARQAAQFFLRWAGEAVERGGRFRVALAGGDTPKALYGLLAADSYRRQVPWHHVHLYWGDERFLPPGHPGRNDTDVLPLWRQAGVLEENIHPVPYVTGPLDPAGHDSQGAAKGLELRMDQAAQRYEALLRRQARPGEPLLDLVLLGLGTDGHTASLFPGTAALDEEDRWVVPNWAAYQDRHPQRITLTLPALNAAEIVMFLVTGEGKRQVLAQVLQSPQGRELPAGRVRPGSGRLVWLADRAAASGLT